MFKISLIFKAVFHDEVPQEPYALYVIADGCCSLIEDICPSRFSLFIASTATVSCWFGSVSVQLHCARIKTPLFSLFLSFSDSLILLILYFHQSKFHFHHLIKIF